MPVALPSDETAKLTPPDADEAARAARGCASAAMPEGGLTTLQRLLLEALVKALTGHPVDLTDFEPLSAEDFALALAPRNLVFRTRVLQIALLAALVLRPLPPEVVDRVASYARELSVDEDMLAIAADFAHGSRG